MLTRRQFANTAAAGLAMASLGGASTLLSGCSAGDSTKDESDDPAQDQPEQEESADPSFYLMDLHCDTIDVLCQLGYGFYTEDSRGYEDGPQDGDFYSNTGAIALDRMEGIGWAQCYGIYTPDEIGEGFHDFYRRSADYFHQQVEEYEDFITQVTDARDIDGVIAEGKVAALLTVENCAALEGDLSLVDEFVEDGVKMASLSWNYENPFASGNKTENGLSDLGKQLVARLEANGIVIDVSHLNDAGFADLAAIATRPFVASHSNSRAVCDVPRNLTDEQFCMIRDLGGVVGLNLYPTFVNGSEDTTGEPDYEESLKDGGRFSYTFDELAAHVEHWLELGGEDVIALGADADGGACPDWCYGAESRPALYEKFVERIGQELADKLFFTNARDFFVRNETL